MRPPEVFRNDIRKCIYEKERKKICKEYNKKYFNCLNDFIINDKVVDCKSYYKILEKYKCFVLT